MEMAAQVRLAVGLAHVIPGATVELRTDDGGVLRAARDLGQDAVMTPCDLRASLLARSCSMLSPVALRMTEVRIFGEGLVDRGGGLYARRCPHGTEERWFATFLAPSSVSRILDECPLDLPDILDATLRPDVELGVVVTALSTTTPELVDALDDASRWASAACYTQELLFAARHAAEGQ
jgi:hypothetical protein